MRVLIVDDEAVVRRGLLRQLNALGGITVVGECGGCEEAVVAIVEQRPDVVLLDVQLGRGTAFEIIEEIGVDAMPLVVFVTAYDRHALKAFEVHALDYVLKPVDIERLQEAMDRAASQLSLQRVASRSDRLEDLLAAVSPERNIRTPGDGASERFVVRDGERLLLLDTDRIEWFESAGNYVRVHSGQEVYVIRATMDRVARRLAYTARFVRVRRSAIVNVRAIASLERYGKIAFLVRLRSGTKIVSSRYYRPQVRQLLASSTV